MTLASPTRRALLGALAFAPATAFAQNPLSTQRRRVVVAQLVDRAGPQADLARDYLAGAKVMFDAANAAGGVQIAHVVHDADPDARREVAQAEALVVDSGAEFFFGASDAALPALATSPVLARRGVPLVAPLSGLPVTADNVWFTRADYPTELQAAVQQLRAYGLDAPVLAVAPDFASGLAATGWLKQAEQRSGTPAVVLAGNGEAAARQIAARKPGAVIVAADTLAYASFGRTLAAQGWYGFLVGLSSVSAGVAREILGSNYSGAMVLTQIAPGPQQSTLRVVREHSQRMRQFLDEPPSAATLAGYIGAAWLVRALSGQHGTAPGDVRRAMQARMDLGDFTLDFTQRQRGSQFVQLAVIGNPRAA